jgi:hypothetical protein
MLNKEKIIMKFRKVNGKQVTFDQAMNYLYTPKEMEEWPLHKYYQEMEFTSIKAAEDEVEHFEFTEDHPFHEKDAVIYRRKQECVPVFSWKCVGSTREFERSMLEPVLEMRVIHSSGRKKNMHSDS